MDDLTRDTFFDGRIRVNQGRTGYRFSIDAVLLADYAAASPASTILDLGTGCGIIPLILGYRRPEVRIWGVEIQEDLAAIARFNVEENSMKGRIIIRCQDMKTLNHADTAGPVELVVSNPPYRKIHSGRMNPSPQKAIARHEIKAGLKDVVEAARRMLEKSGRLAVIYPVERLVELMICEQSLGIEPKFLRMIHSTSDSQARLVLLEGIKGGRPGLKAGPPLVIYTKDGSYTGEVEGMLGVQGDAAVYPSSTQHLKLSKISNSS
jgi:tRNA1Val (adenine37-N6)-methyltransferase